MVQKPKKLLNTHEDLEVYLECRGEDPRLSATG
jgi:hypothetical protein